MLEALRLLAGAGDPPHPALGDPVDRMLLDGPVADRQRDVAAVADHVHEAGLGERPLDPPHALHVDRGLLAPARLADPLRVGRVERAQGVAGVERLDRPEPLQQLLLGEPEVTPLALPGDRRQQRLRRRRATLGGLDQLRDEVRLGRDRQLGVCVEHHPQQRRPGAVDSDDERRRDALGSPRRGAAAPGLAPGSLWARECHSGGSQREGSPRCDLRRGRGSVPTRVRAAAGRARDCRPLPGVSHRRLQPTWVAQRT